MECTGIEFIGVRRLICSWRMNQSVSIATDEGGWRLNGVNFLALATHPGGKEGGRNLFEDLIAQLVRTIHPTVHKIQPNPGDWGIDTYVGQLDDIVSVWQAKYFIDGVGESQKQDIRESFKSLMESAAKRGFQVVAWALCLPVSLDAPTAQWWANWSRKQKAAFGVEMMLWDETELKSWLIRPDAAHVCTTFFGSSRATSVESARAILDVPEGVNYSDMLFLKQLNAGGLTEVSAAKQQFFNFDIVSRDAADRKSAADIQNVRDCKSECHSVWETRYNTACLRDSRQMMFPDLYLTVMEGIERLHNAGGQAPLRLTLVHRLGAMHHVVESGSAGWVRDFRRVVAEHENDHARP